MSLVRSLALAALLTLPAPVLAQTDGDVVYQIDQMFGSADPFVEAFQAIQNAVDQGDRETFVQWVAYPITVSVDGAETEIEDAETFFDNYGSIVNESIADIIVMQRFADLFVNDEGVMFGNGELWLSAICNDDACSSWDVRIITIQNVE